MVESVNKIKKPIIFVCNISNENETSGFTIIDHVTEFKKHTNVDITHVISNSTKTSNTSERNDLYYEKYGYIDKIKVINTDLINNHLNKNHDPNKLSDTIFKVIETLS